MNNITNTTRVEKPSKVFIKWFVVGSIGLGFFYLLVSSVLGGGLSHSFEQFGLLQPWISLLILSFGVQMGLFQLIRKGFGMIGGSSTVSGVSMLLCCVHHVGDILPVLGVSTLGVLLTAYQKDFLILGILVKIFGIFYLARKLRFKLKPVFKYTLALSTGLIMISGVLAVSLDMYKKTKTPSGIVAKANTTLSPQTKQVGVVEVEVTPKQLNHGREMVFTIVLDNHSIDLNYDYTKIAAVVDNEGNIYRPITWTGVGSGHHVSGDLVFDKLSKNASSVGLNIKGIDGKMVNFEWKL